ncbi:hypothetical protein AQUCO_00100351v1 [Aquilegia coerulea]|uniref:Uncharacterized protein n=1 Tax=Aquilegia coerulea TaxID=218851 RepID=A0A2G5F9Y7_AQUCA|nr:hypothetical protein AQUCO_00100351v1 [Aquilegia coerulea]
MNIHATMDPNVVSKLFCLNGSRPCIFFDRSQDVITTFFPNPEIQCFESYGFKRISLDALEEAKLGRNSGIVMEIIKGNESSVDDVSCDEDYEMKSDAATSPHPFIDDECDVEEDYEMKSDASTSPQLSIDNIDDDECDVDDLLCDEDVKNKLEMLARMVGIDCSHPGIVLTEVVTIFKGLQRK